MSKYVRNTNKPTTIFVIPGMREHVGGRESLEALPVVHTDSDRDTGYHYGLVAFEGGIYVTSQLVSTEWHLCARPIFPPPAGLVRLAVIMLGLDPLSGLRSQDNRVKAWLAEHGQAFLGIFAIRRELDVLEQEATEQLVTRLEAE